MVSSQFKISKKKSSLTWCYNVAFQTEQQVALKLFVIILVWVAAWTPFAMILLIQMAGYDYIVHNYVTILSKLFQYLGIKAVMVVQVVEQWLSVGFESWIEL